VDLFELAEQKPEARGRVYLGADEHYYALNDLVRACDRRRRPHRPSAVPAVMARRGSCRVRLHAPAYHPPLFRRRVDWFRQVRAFSIERAKRELGYVPRVGLEEGLRRTGEWYRANGYLWARSPDHDTRGWRQPHSSATRHSAVAMTGWSATCIRSVWQGPGTCETRMNEAHG
jgi:hypothetical protein